MLLLACTPPPVPAAYSAPPAPRSRGYGVTGVILGLGSMGIGAGATSVVVSHHPDGVAAVLMVLLIWAAIAVVNVAHARRNGAAGKTERPAGRAGRLLLLSSGGKKNCLVTG